jgi:hypothetical protein
MTAESCRLTLSLFVFAAWSGREERPIHYLSVMSERAVQQNGCSSTGCMWQNITYLFNCVNNEKQKFHQAGRLQLIVDSFLIHLKCNNDALSRRRDWEHPQSIPRSSKWLPLWKLNSCGRVKELIYLFYPVSWVETVFYNSSTYLRVGVRLLSPPEPHS